MGDIILQCSGSNPGAVLAGNLSVALPVSITNRVDSNNQTTDAVVSADLGSGFVPLPVPGQVTNNTIIYFNGLSVTVPASGNFSLKISNLRANANQLGPNNPLIYAQLGFSSPASIPVNQSYVVVANSQPGLLALLYDRGQITCVGSPVPSTLSVSNFFAAGTNFATTRLTEGFATAFQPRGPGDDTGTRLLIQYSGFPANARLYVPDMVAGSSAAVPTSGGDLGLPLSPGQYVPGSGTLLLVRVPYTNDPTGAGGYPVSAPTGTGPLALDSVSEVPLSNGAGSVVYEVVDANPNVRESVQIPTFVGMPNVTAPAEANASVSFAPISNVTTASQTAPIPRFVAVPPGNDCTAIGDCNAGYFPQLSVKAANSIQLTAVAGGAMTSDAGYIPIQNAAGGIMHWTATAQYVTGTGWLTVGPSSGTNNASVFVTANAKGLAPGTYQGSVLIDAGPYAGSVTIPVTLTVTPAPTTSTGSGSTSNSGTTSGSAGGAGTANPPAAPAVTVTRIVNAATFEPTPLVPGSLGTAMGSNLGGTNVAVTFDGLPANVLYAGASQINFQVPAGLAGKNSANMVVTVDGKASAPQTVVLAPAWPAIFSGGVLNQDSSPNGAAAGAPAGSIVSIWATGIPDGATVSVQMGSRKGLVPLYAGAAPDLPGVQQVNVQVPDDMASGAVPLVVCAGAGSAMACSPASVVTVQ